MPDTMPPLDPMLGDDEAPARADVVVVGGGIVGSCLALFLAEQGVSTVLCEKGVIGGEQSGRNLGWCRSSGRQSAELPLALESLRLWAGMNARIGAETGFRQSGRLFLCETERDVALQEELSAKARPHGIEIKRLDDQDAARSLPQASGSWKAVFTAPADGVAEPQKAAPAIARAARARGAKVLTNCAVRGIELKDGRVRAVATERGTIACSKAVLVTGAWTSMFCRNIGIRFPLLQVNGSVMRTAPIDAGPEECVGSRSFGIRRHFDGSFSVSPFVAVVSLGPSVLRFARHFFPADAGQTRTLRFRFGRSALREWSMPVSWSNDEASPFEAVRAMGPPSFVSASLKTAHANAGGIAPALAHAPIEGRWSGVIDVSPDQLPTIDRVASIPGLLIGAGFSGHGFGLGPGAARLLADLATDADPIVDPTPFRMGRFLQSKAAASRSQPARAES